jgi:hypothetical protein
MTLTATQRAFELGCLAMQRLALAKCGNLTEGLQEGLMTDAGLSKAEKSAMSFQIGAIHEAEQDIRSESWQRAAHYGSYILPDKEQAEIKALFPGDLAQLAKEGRSA